MTTPAQQALEYTDRKLKQCRENMSVAKEAGNQNMIDTFNKLIVHYATIRTVLAAHDKMREALERLCCEYDTFLGKPFQSPPDTAFSQAREALSSIKEDV